MKVNSGQNAFFQNTNLNVILKQLLLYYNLRCFCVICIYFCFVRGSERRMKDRMRDSEFIMNCTYLSLFFPTVLYICFYFFLVLLLYLVLYANHLPHRSLSLISLFHYPRLFLLISDCSFLTFSILMSGGTCLYIFFLLPSLSVFLLLFLIVVFIHHCLSAQTIYFSIPIHSFAFRPFLFLCHLTHPSHPHLLLFTIPNVPSFLAFLVLHCFLLCSLLSTPIPNPAAVQEERQRNKEREGEVESTSAVNEEMPVEKILEAEMAVEQKTELHADGSSGGSSVSSLHNGNPLQSVFLCAFSHIQNYYQFKLETQILKI